MNFKKQALSCLLCLLLISQITSCKPTANDEGATIDTSTNATVEPLKLASAVPVVLPVESNTSAPTLAIYPFLPAPELSNGDSVQLELANAQHAIFIAVGGSSKLIVLERSDNSAKANSPERNSMATQAVADYVLSGQLGTVSTLDYGSKLRTIDLQLSHVASHRLVAKRSFMLDAYMAPVAEELNQFLTSAIARDREEEGDATQAETGFYISLAGVLPTDQSMHRIDTAKAIQDAVIKQLLHEKQFEVVSGEFAYALYLESARSPVNSTIKHADVIVHARLLGAEPDTQGLDLVLFLERINGLRKVISLQAENKEAMSQLILNTLSRQLQTVPVNVSQEKQQAQQHANKAWSAINKDGKVFVNGFPYKVTEKNRKRLDAFSDAIDSALALDSDNYDAIAGKSLLSALKGDNNTAFEMLQRLLWDSRPKAFDLGTQILQKKLNTGSRIYVKGNAAGLPGISSEQVAIEKLVLYDFLIKKDDDEKYWWNFNHDKSPIPSNDEELWEYVFNLKNPVLDSLARFKVIPKVLPTHHQSRTNDAPTGIDARQSLYYALANTVAPLSLSVGKSGFYLGDVELEAHSNDQSQLTQEHIHLFQNLAGMAALGNTPAIEPDILYASSLCRYSQSLCSTSRQIYQSVVNRSEQFRQHIVQAANRPERATLYADSLIAMASSKVTSAKSNLEGNLEQTRLNAQQESTASVLIIQDEDLANVPPTRNAFEPCSDCAGLKSLRNVSASPDGRWIAAGKRYQDVPGRYQPKPSLRAWMFEQGFIDVTGNKTVTRLPRARIKPLLQRDFPDLGEQSLRQIMSEFDRSHYKVDDAGQVDLFHEAESIAMNITSPDLRKEGFFGQKVGLSEHKVLICDQWREGYLFSLFVDAWEMDKRADEFCDESPLALVDEWVVKAREKQLAFYKETAVGFELQTTHSIDKDFTELVGGAVIKSVDVHENLLVVKVQVRRGYFLLVYQQTLGQWQAVSALRFPHHISDVEVFDHRIYHTANNEVLAYHFDGTSLVLESRLRVPETENNSPLTYLLMVRDANREKLIVDAGGQLFQAGLY